MTEASTDPQAFRRQVRIDIGGELRFLDDVADPWQREDFDVADPGWRCCVGLSNEPAPGQRFYFERPRGHSKTSDIAVMASWALLAARRPIVGIVSAAGLDQARLLRDAIDRLVQNNPWLRLLLDVHSYRVTNRVTGSFCEVIPSDASTSFGLTPDFLVCDELTHWRREDFWATMFSSAAKRASCMMVIIANAGMGEGTSWQWKVRESARENPAWHFHRLDGPKASWITEALLAEQRAMLPPAAYRRLWLNQWVRGEGDAIEPADIAACVSTAYAPLESARPGCFYVGGLDLGIKHDHSALVVVEIQPGASTFKLAWCHSWKPGLVGHIDLMAVEAAVLEAHKRFELCEMRFDPSQAILMAQRLAKLGVRMKEVWFTPANLTEMCRALLDTFRNRRIELFPDKDLIRDLERLSIIEREWGYKLDSARDNQGHADRAVALAMVLPVALRASSDLRQAVQPVRLRA